jgi:hypothetical protein|nr:MAG TPA: hypothetical protein [Bacteriophage sp.]
MKSLISKRKEKPVSVKSISTKNLKEMLPKLDVKYRLKAEKELRFRGEDI